ncbi:Bug family tripartite tricarboxylate transporter substrate binding protein [Ralstonia solanacearum]|uniref:Bug family tripartite tricarboxylate transporter substrate binding protein n=1 Tax=Ralstonia solanacearum TaxID=305 RepID=UPI001E62766F|nr:tripartite tricarboxylate transporter substrate binding protein [Ralstonia solanacearum]
MTSDAVAISAVSVHSTRRCLSAAAALLCLSVPLLSATSALAQDYPAKPIRIIVAYPTGGISDNVARALGEKLATQLGQPVVVENRAGAGGSIGMDAVAKSAPDGYTLGFSAVSPLTLNPHFGKLPYDPQKDIAPVINVMYAPMILLGTPSFTGKSFADMLAQSRAKPGTIRWSTSGMGTVGHLALEQVKVQAHVDITLIPYKGGGQQLTDALGGQVEVMSTNVGPTLMQHVSSGKLRPLAVGAPHRLDALPTVPTFAELGYAKANMASTFGVFAPAKTPAPIIARLNTEINKALASPDLRERLTQASVVPVGGTPEQFTAAIRAEYDSNSRIVHAAGIKEQ